jgi:L-rhamnose isomerase
MKKTEKIVPVYKFVDETEDITPAERSISKTMEVTETFKMIDVLTYLARMDKSIADKEAELEGLRAMKKAYEEEVMVIEKQLKVMTLDDKYKKKIAVENEKKQKQLEKELKDELLKTGNFVENVEK